MAGAAKKLLITTEKHELFIVRTHSSVGVNGFCPSCNTEVEMVTVDSAISAFGISGREVIRRLSNDEIHSIEAANGHLLICKRSLAKEKVLKP